MKKTLIVLTLFAFVSAFGIDVPECFKNHQPPIDWPDTYPKGIAGRTIFYAITTDPGPEYFGWDDEDEDFIAMLAIISNYETWYAARMAQVEDMMDDFETVVLTEAQREAKLEELLDLLYDIDEMFMDNGDSCWEKVPSTVQENYIDYMTE